MESYVFKISVILNEVKDLFDTSFLKILRRCAPQDDSVRGMLVSHMLVDIIQKKCDARPGNSQAGLFMSKTHQMIGTILCSQSDL